MPEGAFILFSQLLQCPDFVGKSKGFCVLSKVHRVDEFGGLLGQFIFVVMQHISEAAAGLYDCNHWSLI
jgi:hypothetical protein